MEQFFTPDERAMLVRYCTHFTRDRAQAEDLAQQTLLEAWLKLDQLYAHEIRPAWLRGMARNVCLRWSERQRQEQARLVSFASSEASSDVPFIEDEIEDDVDVELAIERRELAQVLHKAISLLPAQTRAVLVSYYLESLPQTEIAALLGLTVGAVEARLHRGKQALRHLLTHELCRDITGYSPLSTSTHDFSEPAHWQSTHIWCPQCGREHLLMHLPEPPSTLSFRCPGCNKNTQEIGWGYALSNVHFVQYLAGLRQPKAIFRRFTSWAYQYYASATVHNGSVACARCSQRRRLHITLPDSSTPFTCPDENRYGLSGTCSRCGWQDYCSPTGLVLGLPDVQRFWQRYPRMRYCFREPVTESQGQPAWVVHFESVHSHTCLDVVLAQETLNIIAIYGV